MGRSWERRKQGAWKFGLGTFSGPLDIHLILPLKVGLGHSLRGTHRMEGWCWKCVCTFHFSGGSRETGVFIATSQVWFLVFVVFFFFSQDQVCHSKWLAVILVKENRLEPFSWTVDSTASLQLRKLPSLWGSLPQNWGRYQKEPS